MLEGTFKLDMISIQKWNDVLLYFVDFEEFVFTSKFLYITLINDGDLLLILVQDIATLSGLANIT